MKDQLGRELVLENVPKRIVSLVPSQTELLCYIGLEDHIVGITKFCVHPENLKKDKKVVGGTKKVHFNRIRELSPDIILCNKEENTIEMVLELEKIAPVHVSNVISLEDTYQLISQYGKIFKVEDKSSALVNTLKFKAGEMELPLERKKVAYLIWKKPWMAAGGATFINSMLKLNGWQNVFESSESRYSEIEIEELTRLEPDLILLSSEPYPFKPKHIAELRESINSEILLVDGEAFSWYGSRLLKAFDYFKTIR